MSSAIVQMNDWDCGGPGVPGLWDHSKICISKLDVVQAEALKIEELFPGLTWG